MKHFGHQIEVARDRRRGVAATELAVCLPIIVLIVIGTIEASTMVFLKQSLTVAAFQGARQAISNNNTAADVRTAAEQILTQRRVAGGNVVIQPADISTVLPGQYINVTVTAPARGNNVVPLSFYRGRTLSATATMMKEL